MSHKHVTEVGSEDCVEKATLSRAMTLSSKTQLAWVGSTVSWCIPYSAASSDRDRLNGRWWRVDLKENIKTSCHTSPFLGWRRDVRKESIIFSWSKTNKQQHTQNKTKIYQQSILTSILLVRFLISIISQFTWMNLLLITTWFPCLLSITYPGNIDMILFYFCAGISTPCLFFKIFVHRRDHECSPAWYGLGVLLYRVHEVHLGSLLKGRILPSKVLNP